MNQDDKDDLIGTIIIITASIITIMLIIIMTFVGGFARYETDNYLMQKSLRQEWCDIYFCYNTTKDTSRCYDFINWEKYNCTNITTPQRIG